MKIALCLAGKTGGTAKDGLGVTLDPRFGYEHHKKHVLDVGKNDVDIYLHCWNPDQKRTLRKLYHPKRFLFEEPVTKNLLESRIISIKRCLELVERSKINYDFVMISRYDVILNADFDFDKLPKDKFIASHWNDRGSRNNHKAGFYDLWFIASLEIFNEVLDNIPKKFYNMSPHIFWRKRVNEKIGNDEIEYIYYVGKHYELTRRFYYFPNDINNPEEMIKKNLAKFFKKHKDFMIDVKVKPEDVDPVVIEDIPKTDEDEEDIGPDDKEEQIEKEDEIIEDNKEYIFPLLDDLMITVFENRNKLRKRYKVISKNKFRIHPSIL